MAGTENVRRNERKELVMILSFDQSVKLIYGENALASLGEIADELGAKKALIVCDPFIHSCGYAEKAVNVLRGAGKDAVVFDENESNPAIAACEKAYDLCVKEQCDFVIGLGGGSNLDCAKGVNILRFNEAPLIRYANMAEPFDVGHGLVMIPTTAGTGSELSDGAILSDEHHIKHNFIAGIPFADYAILDPMLSAGMPPKLTASTGLDAFTHACEGYTGILSSPMPQFFAEKTMDTIAEYLPRAVADGSDMEARGKMAVASCVGGYLLSKAHTHAGHSVGQTIGGYFDIPHGFSCAYAEPWVLEFNVPAVPELTKRVAESLGAVFTGDETPEEIGAKARDALIEFRDVKCLTPDIRSFAYDVSKFEEIAEVIEVETFQQFNPRKMTAADALVILKKMYGVEE